MILSERDAKLMLIELNIPSLGSDILVIVCMYRSVTGYYEDVTGASGANKQVGGVGIISELGNEAQHYVASYFQGIIRLHHEDGYKSTNIYKG